MIQNKICEFLNYIDTLLKTKYLLILFFFFVHKIEIVYILFFLISLYYQNIIINANNLFLYCIKMQCISREY